jgi:hypothetical protein
MFSTVVVVARLELPRHRPARRARHLAQATLQPALVHLDDDAVDLEGQLVAAGGELVVVGVDVLERLEDAALRHGPESELAERRQELGVRLERDALDQARAVTDEVERAARRDARVELLPATPPSRSGVPRTPVAPPPPLAVQRGTPRPAGTLAAHLEPRGAGRRSRSGTL